MKSEEHPGHHWREPDRVAEYLETSDRRERERAGVLALMIKLVNAKKDARLNILDIGSGHGPWPPHASTRFRMLMPSAWTSPTP